MMRGSFRFTLLMLGLLVLGGSPANAESAVPPPNASAPSPAARRLSLAEAVKLAQVYNPLTQQAAARVTGASARVRSASALLNPLIALAYPYGMDTGGLDEDIVVTQIIELGDKRRQRKFAARSERDSTVADQAATARDLTYSVQSAYYEALRADAEYQLAVESLALARQFAGAAQTQYQAGDVARSNVLRSEVETSRAQQDLTAAETDRAERYDALSSLVGLPGDTPLVLTDKLSFAAANYSLPNLRALALRERPDIRAAKLTRDSLEASLHGARVARQPDLFLEGRHSTLDPTTGGSSVRVGVIFPLLDLGRNRAEVEAAQAAVKEQDARVADLTRVAQLEVETAFRNLGQASRVVESFQSGRLLRAKELLDMQQTGYEKGASSYLDVLDAQRVYRAEEADYARALATYNVSKANLERAVGGQLK